MNSKLTKCTAITIFAVILGIGAFTTSANAQSASAFKIDIPFDFVVAGRAFTAGEYRIGRLDRANPNILVLKNQDSNSQLILRTRRLDSGSQDPRPVLTFDRFTDAYVLTGFSALGQTNRPGFAKADRDRQTPAKYTETISLTSK